jgi:hypothetical protein
MKASLKLLTLAATIGVSQLASAATPVYVIRDNGDLSFYKHAGTYGGTVNWPIQNSKIGTGWTTANAKSVFAGPNGSIYVIRQDGTLSFYKHTGNDNGAANWAVQNVTIGSGWQNFTKVFAGDNDNIYAITTTGDLLLYKFTSTFNGVNNAPNSVPVNALKIGTGWNIFSTVFAGENNTLYGIKPTGELLFYRHAEPLNKIVKYIVGGKQIGSGWNAFIKVFPGEDGNIYGVESNGNLKFYKFTGTYNGAFKWPVQNKLIGSGWNTPVDIFTSTD